MVQALVHVTILVATNVRSDLGGLNLTSPEQFCEVVSSLWSFGPSQPESLYSVYSYHIDSHGPCGHSHSSFTCAWVCLLPTFTLVPQIIRFLIENRVEFENTVNFVINNSHILNLLWKSSFIWTISINLHSICLFSIATRQSPVLTIWVLLKLPFKQCTALSTIGRGSTPYWRSSTLESRDLDHCSPSRSWILVGSSVKDIRNGHPQNKCASWNADFIHLKLFTNCWLGWDRIQSNSFMCQNF